jgi:filamentous hemagglutinin
MKRALAVFLCLGITFLPAIGNAGAGAKIPGFDRAFLPPLPKPKTPDKTGAAQPELKLTVAPKPKHKDASVRASSSPATLPVAVKDSSGNIILGPGISSISVNSNQNEMVITQNKQQAIQNWNSFNISANGGVQFEQPNSSSVALNRIFDLNPTQIFGKLTANGQIYLINQNGILFGRGSQVDVHTLIASSLDMSDLIFESGALNFTAQDYQGTGNTNYLNASVINQGKITTDTLGSVFLLGPNVTNSGTIQTQAGQIGLAAGTGVTLAYNAALNTTDLQISINQNPGQAANNGRITANNGLIGMYGENVTQNGVISAVSAIKQNGEIDLEAVDTVSTGAGSITSTPISTSKETVDQSFVSQGGVINIGGMSSTTPVQTIVLGGLLQAQSGTITLDAAQRVFMAKGSRTDVSGCWIKEPAAAAAIQVQMNSENLRDEPIQKNGLLLGRRIWVNPLFGSSIGDISGALQTQNTTAQQRSLKGGTIQINSSGDIIVKQGATINFSGGGIRYAAGYVPTTELAAGPKVYDISNAPEDLHYNRIINTDTYESSYLEGSNAGTLAANAFHIVLDGRLEGSATSGVYQTKTAELNNSFGNQKTLGLAVPTGGTLIIGNAEAVNSFSTVRDFSLSSVVLAPYVTPLSADFGPSDQPYAGPQPTILSTNVLNAAGLSNLQIYANTTLAIDAGAQIAVSPGGSFTAAARQILNQGAISAPGGQVNLTLMDNVTSFEPISASNPSLVSQIILAGGSSIDVSGQRINNSALNPRAATADNFSFVGGGKVSLFDETQSGEGVLVQNGAGVNVSGGYGINQKGSLTGGNAGKLSIQGSNIILQGNLAGYSLVGNNGGTIQLIASSVEVTSSPQDIGSGGLILGSHQLDGTGFTQIDLEAANNLTFDPGALLSTSLVKLATPTPGIRQRGNGLITVTESLVGASSIKAIAGVTLNQGVTNLNAELNVSNGADLKVAPGGSITMNAPNIDIAGTLEAPAGQIILTATQKNLTLESTGQMLAAGYNKPAVKPIFAGLPVGYTPMSGGSVTLSAPNGSVTTQAGSVVDVSGSSPVKTHLLNGKGVPVALTVASNPGSITISAFTPSLNGMLEGEAKLAGLQGGTLSISSLNTQAGYTISNSAFGNYLAGGFDALTFSSYEALVFSGPMNFTVARSLTFDAPCFTDLGNDQLKFQAPLITLQDTYTSGLGQAPVTSSGASQLTLAGGWLDVNGAFSLTGFQNVTLSAVHDLALSDFGYSANWQGQMITSANLTLQADRIYPTTLSDFTVNSGGTVTILPSGSHNSSPIYSAGGDLTIQAQNIDMEGGELAAPMGQISLLAPSGRVYLASGSTVSTAGSIAVDYGSLNDVFWTTVDKSNIADINGISVPGAPQSSVNITGSEVIMKTGSTINISGSGGGSIFAYQFQAGIQGSVDPFQTAGRYVIVPSGNYSLPGPAVYLQGAKGLPAGVYSILPEQYAFLPGAMVITNTGANVTPGTKNVSADGFPVVAGYFTTMGTSIRPSLMEAFEVQPAAYVLKQGLFNTASFVAGNAGSAAINGNTTVLDGVILASALKGYQGGSISLSGTNAFIQASTVPLPSDFNFETPVSDVPGLAGTLQVAAGALSGKGFQEINIGDLATTKTITLEQGSILDAASVVLSAQNSITLDSGAQINAVDSTGTGSASLITPTGLLNMQPNSLVHASDLVTMTIGQLNFQGGLQIDHGTLNLTGQNVYFVPQGSSQPQTDPLGLYLSSAFWGRFGSFQNVQLSASAGLVEFMGDINLSAQNSFTINAAAIKASNAPGIVSDAVNAPIISLLNTGGLTLSSSLQNVSSLSLNANEIWVGEGALLLDGFASVNFNAVNDITFRGIGSLNTGGNLNFSSARITTSYYTDANTPYTAANFQITAGGTVTIAKSGRQPDTTSAPGGTLGITAAAIDDSGIVDVSSGYITFTATGSGPGSGIFLGSGSEILARGCAYAPGGNVQLNTGNGALTMEQGALIDVTAGSQGDAGSISIAAPVGGASLQGTFAGAAQPGGTGGSFSLDTYNLGDGTAFSSLYSKLGDFTGSVDIETRTGDLTVNSGVTVTAQNVQLTADSGNLNLSGAINASNASGGGSVQLYARQNLTLYNGSLIGAAGLQGNSNGGTILLSTTQGNLAFQQGATLDVSASGSGQGGTVYLRAPVNTAGSDVNMNLAGAIKGATQILAEGFQYGTPTGVSAQQYTYNNLTITSTSSWQNGIQTFMNTYGSAIQTRLLTNLTLTGGSGSAGFNFVPGLEIDSTGSLTLNSAWNLTPWRYGVNSVPGMLTLRAGGGLVINQNLTDAPTSYTSLTGLKGAPSWGLNLVAGADFSSSNFMAAVRGTGNLTIADGMMVYTESAPIRFASGNDTLIGRGSPNGLMIDPTIRYNLGSYSGSVQGNVGGNLTIDAGAIQTATGDIDITVGGNLSLETDTIFGFTNGSGPSALGSIRTTGCAPAGQSLSSYWLYDNGGSITLRIAGAVQGNLQSNAWDNDYEVISRGRTSSTSDNWSAQYVTVAASGTDATEGLATMAGGNLTVYSGGDFFSQIGTFGYGQGNLTIFSGGNILGRFLVRNGRAELSAMGNFGNSQQLQLIEAAPALPESPTNFVSQIPALNVQINVTAQGGLYLAAVVNPTLAENIFSARPNLGYSQTSSVSLTAVTGDVVIAGNVPSFFSTSYTPGNSYNSIMPATLDVNAGQDILLTGNITLAPYADGTLSLVAGGNIDGQNTALAGGRSQIVVSDADPALAYGRQTSAWSSQTVHDPNVLHLNDTTGPVIISAGGDLENINLVLPKAAEISAGRDILNIYYQGQNVAPSDVTTITAAGNITLSSTPEANTTNSGIQVTGPGYLVVQAGGSIDLGTTGGIQSLGNSFNPGLASLYPQGASVMVISGFTRDISWDDATAFFDALRNEGTEYSKLQAEGDTADAQEVIKETRKTVIEPFIGDSATKGAGDINMTTSQISTLAGGDIYVFSNGKINVGQTAFVTSAQTQSTGIFTGHGGDINIFSVKDVNVNESRVMTFFGGNITMWSDTGNINAGRGSTTEIDASPPTLTYVNGQFVLEFNPPEVGSGIRALTYAPGEEEAAPLAGNVYLFAPQGVIDAGQAGIAGNQVILGAVQVLNANNISFSSGSVGVPVSTSLSGLGALTGTSAVTQALQDQQAAVMSAAAAKLAPGDSASDVFSTAWLEVRVLSFFEVDPGDSGWENTDN